MTKKEKQPRDGMGKFVKQTPMIALHSKDGSTAYFSSVEEMEKFTKTSNLKFKERIDNNKPIALYGENGNVAYFTKEELAGFKNPDCEPATKGFVKCLMRKTRNHTHIIRWEGTPISLSLLGGCIASIILGAGCLSVNETARNIGNQYFVPVFLFTIVVTCIFCEFMNFEVEEIKECVPPELQKYTPPTCEKKDECD
ncbi:MAG: hypothetical protein WCX79_00590 [Candidatus Paceibacterota bacterium]|jgi:hypothetical protein